MLQTLQQASVPAFEMSIPIVLPQNVDAIVVAVRRPDDRVNMELERLGVGQEQPRVVVELDKDHGALDGLCCTNQLKVEFSLSLDRVIPQLP